METKNAIRVFVSHSSHDKERFVEPLALRLRQRGIDAWLDKWEMLPGDSLVDKIFEEGLKEAAAFVIVLSHASVSSEWVRKELNTATVHSIEKGTKLIPIVLDDCEIPACLKDKVYVRINDLEAFEAEFSRIVASIESRVLKPPLGLPPNYAAQSVPHIPGLKQADSCVLRELGNCVLNANSYVHIFIPEHELDRIRESLAIEEHQLRETMLFLKEIRLLEYLQVTGAKVANPQLSHEGFKSYANAFYERFSEDWNKVSYSIVNGRKQDSDIALSTEVPVIFVRFAMEELERQNMLSLCKTNMGYQVLNYAEIFKRRLQDFA